MSILKGDFLGFTFDGIHSSELGVFRVSDGSRYSENLLPTIQDKTTQIPGNDGTYYQGSFYTQRQINFSIAFDELSEKQLRRLKSLFGDKNIHSLVFDELPYKVYKVKTIGTPNLKYVCFDSNASEYFRLNEKGTNIRTKESLYSNFAAPGVDRVYKGEGQLNFVAYAPYAKSRFKYIDEYLVKEVSSWGTLDTNYAKDVSHNLYEWSESSRMVHSATKKKINNKNYILDTCTDSGVLVYNAGDVPTNFILRFYFSGKFTDFTLGDVNNDFLKITGFSLYQGDKGFQINTKLNLLEGINENGEVTGTIYNKYLTHGDFFKIPVTEDPVLLPYYFILPENNPVTNLKGEIEYQYLYY